MSNEISGDGRLTLTQRLRYLAQNLYRNTRLGTCAATRIRFTAGRLPRTPSTASPGRALTEAFLHSELPKMHPPGELRVLEIGCGSGSLTKLLTEFGYSGSYVGVDIANRFDHAAQSAFLRLRLRQRLPWLYGWMLDRCLNLDRLVPGCGTMYAVCQAAAPIRSDAHD